MLSYHVYQTKGTQDKTGQNLDLDFFDLDLLDQAGCFMINSGKHSRLREFRSGLTYSIPLSNRKYLMMPQ